MQPVTKRHSSCASCERSAEVPSAFPAPLLRPHISAGEAAFLEETALGVEGTGSRKQELHLEPAALL